MLLQKKTALAAAAGAGAGLCAWIFGDVAGLLPTLSADGGLDAKYVLGRAAFMAVVGGAVGAAVGLVDGADRGHSRRWRTATAGLGLGACGGIAGAVVSALLQIFWSIDPTTGVSDVAFSVTFISVALGWGIMGAAAGAAPGTTIRSGRIAGQGAAGGLAGGLLGGAVTQIIAEALEGSPDTADLLWLGSICATGLLIGLLATTVPDMLKQAYVIYGRGNSIDEVILGPKTAVIGTDKSCDIVLPPHSAFAPAHAVIEPIPETRRHRLRHTARTAAGGPSYASTYLNGEALTSEKWLVDRDTIQLGDMRIVFREKATEKGVPGFAGPPTTAQPVQAPIPIEMRTRLPGGTDRAALLAEMDAEVAAGRLPGTTAGTDRLIGTRLVGISGPYQGQAFPLTHEEILIGRALDNAIALAADPSVSRTHARIVYENSRHLISDPGSSHGVLVNNEWATFGTALRRGDIISLGETRLRYE